MVSVALVGEQLVLAHVGEPAALAPGAARVGHEPVAVDPQRQVGLDQLDRLVATRFASGFETPSSPSRPARAPQLPTITSVEHERLAVLS